MYNKYFFFWIVSGEWEREGPHRSVESGDLDAVVREDHDELGDGDVVRLEKGGEIGVLERLDVEADRIGAGGAGRRGGRGRACEGIAAEVGEEVVASEPPFVDKSPELLLLF